MNTNQIYKGPANIKSFQVFSDASGATAVIEYGRFIYSFDLLGEVTCNLLKPVYSSRIENKIAHDICTKAYATLVASLPADFIAANKALYA